MNKKVKTLLAASALTFAMGTTALADNTAVTELKQAMIEIGIPSNYIGNVVWVFTNNKNYRGSKKSSYGIYSTS